MLKFLPKRRSLRQKRILAVECLEERQVPTASTMWDIGNGVYDLTQTFQLHSNPTAKHTIYLDFDGFTTGNVTGSSWDNLTSPAWDLSGNGASFTNTEKETIQRIWTRVAEDYAPFNVNVTTQDPGIEALRKSGTGDDRWGIRVVITPNDKPAPGAGGVAYLDSFNYSDQTPVYVFNTSERGVAEAASHEVGHALGLDHDGTSSSEYYSGHGSGVTGWGAIMGAAYDPNVTQFSKGEFNGANNKEDDLVKITTLNGFTYRTDDFGSTQAGASALLPQGAGVVTTTYGIIERNTDADWFSFWSDPGTVAINVDPLKIGPNLAVRADLYNAAGTLLTTVNPASALNAPISFSVIEPGQYFIKITGTGKNNPATNGFSNYGSLGNYRITGAVQPYTGDGTVLNFDPIANADSAITVAGTPVTLNVLANDSDPNGDSLTLLGISNVLNGTAEIFGNSVIFTPTPGFTGVGSFSYNVGDGQGGFASADASVTVNSGSTPSPGFTNNTDLIISASRRSIVTSTINVSGLAGTLQDVNVSLNLKHTWVSDLKITLISPSGTRITLFNRYGSSGDNLLNTTFDDAAAVFIANGAAPYSGTFRPTQSLGGLNGKNPNGVWKLEIQDSYAMDGGFLDNWTLSLKTTGAAKTTVGYGNNAGLFAPPVGTGAWTFTPNDLSDAPTSPDQAKFKKNSGTAKFDAIKHWLADHASHGHHAPQLESDLPAEPKLSA